MTIDLNQINDNLTQVMAKFQGLEQQLEIISVVLLAIVLIEAILDFCWQKQRNYRETLANIGIGIIQEGVNSLAANAVGLVGLSLFAILSPWQLPINGWTILISILLTDFCYYWNHRVHHGANPIYIDKNYGGIFTVWDRLFGTYQPETEQVYYGLTENIGTSNMFKINLIGYGEIISAWQRSRNWQQRCWSVFGPPEWKPSKLRIKN
jgi:sterol desaturase/sphingolipid hydroxylase (fatty acid hydroxylase superfamily)